MDKHPPTQILTCTQMVSAEIASFSHTLKLIPLLSMAVGYLFLFLFLFIFTSEVSFSPLLLGVNKSVSVG